MPFTQRGDAHYNIDEHKNHIRQMEDTATKFPKGSQWHLQGRGFTVEDVVSTGPGAIIWLVANWHQYDAKGLVQSTHHLLEEL